MAKCGECTAPASAFCVELNRVLCRQCVGRLFYPSLKSADFTLEALDQRHPGVQTVTVYIMHASVIVGMLLALWNSGLGDDYFKGTNTCPCLSLPRQWLARFDPNMFYYFKPSLTMFCDAEDSFWRLLMDGWLRGVVGGTDSLLLLASTLPKAMMFKSAVTFLRPVYTLLYALCAVALSTLVIRLEDAGSWLCSHWAFTVLSKGSRRPAGAASKFTWFKAFVRLPARAWALVTTKRLWFEKAQMLFIAIGLSTALRLFVHEAGFHRVAALGNKEDVSVWQLAFEPLLFFFLARQCGHLNVKLNKTLWKRGLPTVAVPLTQWRMKPRKDVVELLTYTKARMFRSYSYYQKQAQEILHILVDDVFYLVVMLRLLGIFFHLAPAARVLCQSVGLGPLLERHQEWFMQATGIQEVDAGARYLSERVFRFSVFEVFAGFRLIEQVVEAEAIEVITHVNAAKQVVWRILIPVVLFYLESKWAALLKAQQKVYKDTWQGKDWKDGGYNDMLQQYGSYWNLVKHDEWETPKERAAREAAAQSSPTAKAD